MSNFTAHLIVFIPTFFLAWLHEPPIAIPPEHGVQELTNDEKLKIYDNIVKFGSLWDKLDRKGARKVGESKDKQYEVLDWMGIPETDAIYIIGWGEAYYVGKKDAEIEIPEGWVGPKVQREAWKREIGWIYHGYNLERGKYFWRIKDRKKVWGYELYLMEKLNDKLKPIFDEDDYLTYDIIEQIGPNGHDLQTGQRAFEQEIILNKGAKHEKD